VSSYGDVVNPRERRAARHQPASPEARTKRRRKAVITVDQVVDTALGVIAAEGYEALTMRRLATALDTGPASLYVHVVNKADLDELLIGRLCAELVLPEPAGTAWREQVHAVCAQLRDQYLRYPGISRAALAMAPTDVEVIRVSEGLLAILLTGGVTPQAAAWAVDTVLLYVAAYCLEVSVARQRSADEDAAWVVDRDELIRRFTALPAETFPNTVRHAGELTAGEGHDRFDFTLTLLLDGLAQPRYVESVDMSSKTTVNAAKGEDELTRLTRWREAIDGLRPRVTGQAWRHGERNVARLAKALGVSRDTVYADLRDQHIDYRDRNAPVRPDGGGLPEYEYVNERVVDAMVAANAVLIGLRAMAEGHDPRTRAGRCQLLESVLGEISTDEISTGKNLVQCDISLERGTVDIPGAGETPVWRGTSVDPIGRRIGWGLLGITDVDNLAQIIATVPTLPAKPRRCLIHVHSTTTVSGIQWGDTTVDTVLIGRPIWIYRK
jgi:AcrR family transcriptional regulator